MALGTFQTRRNDTPGGQVTYNVTVKNLSTHDAVDMLRNYMPVNHTLDMVRRRNVSFYKAYQLVLDFKLISSVKVSKASNSAWRLYFIYSSSQAHC